MASGCQRRRGTAQFHRFGHFLQQVLTVEGLGEISEYAALRR